MRFTWDKHKNQTNFKKHGIWFEEARELFSHTRIESIDNWKDYGELRMIAIGEIAKKVIIVLIYTQRNSTIQIISARIASRKERHKYYEHTKS